MACCAIEFIDGIRSWWCNTKRRSNRFERSASNKVGMRVSFKFKLISIHLINCFRFAAFAKGPTGNRGFLFNLQRKMVSPESQAYDLVIKYSAVMELTSVISRLAKRFPSWRTRRFWSFSWERVWAWISFLGSQVDTTQVPAASQGIKVRRGARPPKGWALWGKNRRVQAIAWMGLSDFAIEGKTSRCQLMCRRFHRASQKFPTPRATIKTPQ